MKNMENFGVTSIIVEKKGFRGVFIIDNFSLVVTVAVYVGKNSLNPIDVYREKCIAEAMTEFNSIITGLYWLPRTLLQKYPDELAAAYPDGKIP
jgi:hypothetical protein